MKKMTVVVLNYINYRDTIECVNSLLKQVNIDLKVVIVDNGSKNESYNVLKDTFSFSNKTICLKSDDNLGYARGNNIGIHYSLKKLNIDNNFYSKYIL